MPMSSSEIERFIKEALPDAEVVINDLRGDGDHYAAFVKSAEFKGKSREPHFTAPTGPAQQEGEATRRCR